MIKDYEIHPAAKLFPMLEPAELKELAEDIRAHGLINSIILFEGKILDGRNRLVACGMAEVDPHFECFRMDISPVKYVISQNLKRRHLNANQRGAVATEALPLLEAEAKERQTRGVTEKIPEGGEAREKAAEMFDVNPHYVSDCKRIKEESPEVFEQIKAGEKTIAQAKSDMQFQCGDCGRSYWESVGHICKIRTTGAQWNGKHAIASIVSAFDYAKVDGGEQGIDYGLHVNAIKRILGWVFREGDNRQPPTPELTHRRGAVVLWLFQSGEKLGCNAGGERVTLRQLAEELDCSDGVLKTYVQAFREYCGIAGPISGKQEGQHDEGFAE
jgi:hypothetical protein